MIDAPRTPTRDERRAAHNRDLMALVRRVLRLNRDETLAHYTDLAGPTPETGRALSAAITITDGEIMALSDQLFDLLHPQAPFLPASRDPQLAALETQIAALRRELAGTRAEAAKWRSTITRTLDQYGLRTQIAAGVSTAHDD